MFWDFSHFYLMQKVDSSNSPNFPCVVDKSHISLSGGVKLPNLNVPKAIEKLSPYLCSDTVANGQSYFMVLVIFSLHFHRKIKINKSSILQVLQKWFIQYLTVKVQESTNGKHLIKDRRNSSDGAKKHLSAFWKRVYKVWDLTVHYNKQTSLM